MEVSNERAAGILITMRRPFLLSQGLNEKVP
jgi:hypothetical protein